MKTAKYWIAATLVTGLSPGLPSSNSLAGEFMNSKWLVSGEILRTVYDGVSDDLLTAGLGKSGLGSSVLPPIADPLNPTAAELRRRAIHANYRALVDTAPGGGFGTLFGPNIDAEGIDTGTEGLIAGVEYLAFAGANDDDERGRANVTMMVQVPASFDPADPCIVTGPSSGSRGVYGAIGTSGEWGLKNGCAVAYTDKGTGTGAHNLKQDTVSLITGERVDADDAGRDSNFTAPIRDRKLERFNTKFPEDRFAFKHAHSRLNPEKDWGRDVLGSIKFAFWALNEEFPGHEITPENTIVIASSVSNGGGASTRAAEQDTYGLIDGVAVSEPNVNPSLFVRARDEDDDDGDEDEFNWNDDDDNEGDEDKVRARFAIIQGDGPPLTDHSRSLFDYTTLLNVYQACANLDPETASAPLNLAPSAARCDSLAEKGLAAGSDSSEIGDDAQRIINEAGILEEQNLVQPIQWFAFVPQAIAVTYANSYGRARVEDNVCGYSFGATDSGNPIAIDPAVEAVLFGSSNGIPPTGGVNLINNDSVGGPKEDRVSISPSTGRADQNLDGALCLRALATGVDPVTGKRLRGRMGQLHKKILRGIDEVRASGDLHGIPTVIVTGRNDAILPPNHASRAYVGLNGLVEGEDTGLRYYEVLNAQHLDILNGLPGFGDKFIPLHHYFIQALDRMLDHLRNGTPLPPSQVVRTVPRGGGDSPPPISAANVPAIADIPDSGDEIVFDGEAVRIPE